MDTESSTSETIELLSQFLCENYSRCEKIPTVETTIVNKALNNNFWLTRDHIRSHYGTATQMAGVCGPYGRRKTTKASAFRRAEEEEALSRSEKTVERCC